MATPPRSRIAASTSTAGTPIISANVVPMQSMVVADISGKIGLIAPGRVPVRDPANKIAGRAPVPVETRLEVTRTTEQAA